MASWSVVGWTASGGKPDYFDLALDELAQVDVVTASLAPQGLEDLPASVSVITRKQIHELGARNLYDLLRLVPGVQIDHGNRGRPVISVRGVRRDSSNHLLFMLDGHVLNEPANGSAAFLYELTRMPVHNIQRIEVLRGPGSTVFGANAFLGVVNIITRSPDQVAGTEFSLRSEFDAHGNLGQTFNVLSGGRLGDGVKGVVNMNIVDQSGTRITVEADAAGRAGEVDNAFDQFDLQARIETDSTSFKARFTHQTSGEHYGVFHELAPDDESDFSGGFLELRNTRGLTDAIHLKTRLYGDFYQGETRVSLFPRGTVESSSAWFAFNDIGAFAVVSQDLAKYGLELQVSDLRLPGHRITYGALLEYQSQSNLRTLRNFIGTTGPFEPLLDVSDTEPFGKDAHRTVVAPFVEDVWQLSPELNMNIGLRLDSYSDFGHSFNPRIGMNWRFQPGYRLRAQWGTAFRAPDFRSLYLDAGTFFGNPDLQEERIQTLELGLGGQITDRFSVDATLFHNRLNNMIDLPAGASQFENGDRLTTRGLELDVRYDFLSGASLTSNYTYLDCHGDDSSCHVGEPRHSGSLTATTPFNGRWYGGMHLIWRSDSPRAAGDERDALSGYLLFNTNVGFRWTAGVSLEAAVFNLFDQDHAYPAAADTYRQDLPAAGRSFIVGVKLDL